MSLLNRILGRDSQGPKPRVRVCLECGMPLDQHKQWCAIWQTQREMEKKRKADDKRKRRLAVKSEAAIRKSAPAPEIDESDSVS